MVNYVEEVKTCSTGKWGCGLEKSVVEFNKNQALCRDCDRARSRKINIERNGRFKIKYPAPDKAVYAFLEGNEIVYIGESDNCSFRINNHLNNKSPINNSVFKEINTLERKKRFRYEILWYGDNDEYRKSQEKELIKLHQPKFNKTYK